ncbi:MAG: hypothetical protein WA667_23885 [Candidatus Nitrosopolaris sp.]
MRSTNSTIPLDQLREEAEKAFDRRDYAKSLELHDQILDSFPSDISAINRKGIVLSLLNRYDEALLQFSSAIYLNGTMPELWANKSLTLYYV